MDFVLAIVLVYLYIVYTFVFNKDNDMQHASRINHWSKAKNGTIQGDVHSYTNYQLGLLFTLEILFRVIIVYQYQIKFRLST